MKRLLRSIIDFGGTVTQENLLQNFTKLRDSRLDWERPEDEHIFKYALSYFQQHMEMPSVTTVSDYFSASDDTEVIARLEVVGAAEVYIRTNFTHLLTSLTERQNQYKAVGLLKEAQEIVSKGLIVTEGGEKVKKQGVRDGLMHFATKANDLILPDYLSRQKGEIRKDGQAVWDEYMTAKMNKDKVWGKFTGLNNIDKICHGLKKGEMHLHAGYAGELKTTFATNWCYNLVSRFRTNVFYASFEMKYEHIRRLIYVIHSANNRWPALGYPTPLDYRKVRDGELSDDEEIFYQKVIDDFCNNPEYCEFHLWSPDHDVSVEDAQLEVEMLHKQIEVGFTVLDHGGLMEPRKKKRNKDYVIELNSIIRDSKKFALHFNHGEGMPTLLLFQINRQGKVEADKNDGLYKMNALSYANEAEKSADVVTTSYLNESLRNECQTKLCNLKNRDNPLFEPFLARVNFATRRIKNLDMESGPGMGVNGPGDATDQMLDNV
jgi:replicative DNA helicase